MRRTPRTLGLVAMAAALVLPACSGGDDEPDAGSAPVSSGPSTESSDDPTDTSTSEPTDTSTSEPTDTSTSEPTDTSTSEPTGTDGTVITEPDAADAGSSAGENADQPSVEGDTIVVADLSELPDECVDHVVDMLREIEPVVSQVDWDTATLDELDSLMLELEDEFTALEDADEASGCSRYEFDDEVGSFDAMLELAEREAPGAVGWLTFLQTFLAGVPDVGTGTDPNPAVPGDCDGAIAYLEGVIAGGGTFGSLPVAELTTVSQALDVVATTCDPDTLSEFFDREDVAAFLS